MTGAKEITIPIPGLRLSARAWGSGEGPPVLALHGWLDSAATFDPLARRLEQINLVALDLPGHGLSEHRHESAGYDFISWLPDVLATSDHLGWERFSLLGHSLGGGIGTCLAGAFPDRVERLIVIDGLGPLSGEPDAVVERLRSAVKQRVRRRGISPRVYPTVEDAARRRQEASGDLTEAAALNLARRGTRVAPGGVAWRHDPRLQAHSLLRLTEAHVRAFISAVACPVLAVQPVSGLELGGDLREARLSCVADLTLETVDGGHHVHLTHPDRVVGAIQDFLSTDR